MKRCWIALGLAVLAIGLGVAGLALAGSNEQTCPDGQTLTRVEANGFVGENRKPPPPGMHYSDVSGGTRVGSDKDSASGNVPLRIECR